MFIRLRISPISAKMTCAGSGSIGVYFGGSMYQNASQAWIGGTGKGLAGCGDIL
jgi:hypothetical protein